MPSECLTQACKEPCIHAWVTICLSYASQPQCIGDSKLHVRRRYQHDLEGVMPAIQDPKALREAVKRLYEAHVNSGKEDAMPDGGALDVAERYGNTLNLQCWICIHQHDLRPCMQGALLNWSYFYKRMP